MRDILITGVLCLLAGFTVGEKFDDVMDTRTCKCPVIPEFAFDGSVIDLGNQLLDDDDVKMELAQEVETEQADQAVPVPELHLTLFFRRNSRFSAQYTQYERWFDTHSGLAELKRTSNFNVLYNDDPRFSRYDIAMVPAVLLQTTDGQVVYAAEGNDFPNQASTMYAALEQGIAECPWCRPRPQPAPTPAPVPAPPAPILEQEPVPDKSGLPLSLLNILLLAAGGGGAGFLTGKEDDDA